MQRLCGVSPHSQRSAMIHHIPGRLIRPSRCSNTISMVFSFQTVRFSRTDPLAKTEAALSSCRRPKGRAAAQGLETWKVCSFRFIPSRLLPGAGLPYIRTSPPQDCKCRGGKCWKENPLRLTFVRQIPPFVATRYLPPARGKSFLSGGAFCPLPVSTNKALPFGRAGIAQR